MKSGEGRVIGLRMRASCIAFFLLFLCGSHYMVCTYILQEQPSLIYRGFGLSHENEFMHIASVHLRVAC